MLKSGPRVQSLASIGICTHIVPLFGKSVCVINSIGDLGLCNFYFG